MKDLPHIQRPSPTPLETHLETALEATDDERAKFHLREAYQKCLADSEHGAVESP